MIKAGIEWLLAATVGAVVVAFLSSGHMRQRRYLRQRIDRLAAEVLEVADSIRGELEQFLPGSNGASLAQRCDECRVHALEATPSPWLSLEPLTKRCRHLHDVHRRIVDLRSELDAVLYAQRHGKAARACRFATGSRPVRSRWSSTGSPTRPTSLD